MISLMSFYDSDVCCSFLSSFIFLIPIACFTIKDCSSICFEHISFWNAFSVWRDVTLLWILSFILITLYEICL